MYPLLKKIVICKCMLSKISGLFLRKITTMSSSGELCFPKTLEEFGYRFNDCGKLRKIDPKTGESTDSPFEFNISSDPSYNQKRYEALGEVFLL